MSFTTFCEGLYDNCDKRLYWQPHHFFLDAERVEMMSKSGHLIRGLYFASKKEKELGVVLYFNSTHFNLSQCLPQVASLPHAGFSVVAFDYSGSGESEGNRFNLNCMADDAEAAWKWTVKSGHSHDEKPILFAQGLGCEGALTYVHRHPGEYKAVILENPFASRAGWAKDRWGPFLGDIVARNVSKPEIVPTEVISTIREPMMVLYPEKGKYVRKTERGRVFASIPPTAHIWVVPGGHDRRIFGTSIGHEKKLIDFLQDKVCKAEKKSKNGSKKNKKTNG